MSKMQKIFGARRRKEKIALLGESRVPPGVDPETPRLNPARSGYRSLVQPAGSKRGWLEKRCWAPLWGSGPKKLQKKAQIRWVGNCRQALSKLSNRLLFKT
eukprot:EG_transcript_60462